MIGVAQSFFIVLVCLCVASFSHAQGAQERTSSQTALYWLNKAAMAPRELNYRGIFSYFSGDTVETSKVIHIVDEEGEHEKIEALDGLSRVVIRQNNVMRCYFPDSKTIVTERRWFRKYFPDILPQPFEDITKNYQVKKLTEERIAGYDSQIIYLKPKDDLRFEHKIWIDKNTGLVLRIATIEQENVLEQFSFAELKVGKNNNIDLLESSYLQNPEEWVNHNLLTPVLKNRKLLWRIRELPDGFKIVIEMKRKLTGESKQINHIVLSDGIASVSVFIKENSNNHPHTAGFLSNRGATNIYLRTDENYMVTTVGEVPQKTVKLIGDAVIKRQAGL